MLVVNVSTLKTKLSEKLRLVKKGESLVITDRKTPIASIIPYGAGDELLIERKAVGRFHTVVVARPSSIDIDALALLEVERGDR
jgi:prevent-host-death family protein